MLTIIDGEEVADDAAVVSAFDWSVQRGYGCFEVIRVYRGSPFRLDAHLDRFAASAGLLGLTPAARDDLAAWILRVSAGDCLVRLFMTAGSRDPDRPVHGKTVVIQERLPDLPAELRFVVLPAAWHTAGGSSLLLGAKTLSYANNMVATAAARDAGFDDALLVTEDGTVLEGPTFCIGWFREDRLYTPELDLGILASITRAAALEAAASLGTEVVEGRYHISELENAAEVLALSTVKEVRPVSQVGEVSFPSGPATAKLRDSFWNIVAAETGA